MPRPPAAFAFLLAAALLPAALAQAQGQIVVYRCETEGGGLSLQDEPCAAGQSQRELRYDAPPPPPARRPAPAAFAPDLDDPDPAEDWDIDAGSGPDLYAAATVPPLFQCRSFDDRVHLSESDDGNRRCVPLAITRPGGGAAVAGASACEWVSDSCRLLEADEACDGWTRLQRQAAREARESSSANLGEKRAALRRIETIRAASCSR